MRGQPHDTEPLSRSATLLLVLWLYMHDVLLVAYTGTCNTDSCSTAVRCLYRYLEIALNVRILFEYQDYRYYMYM